MSEVVFTREQFAALLRLLAEDKAAREELGRLLRDEQVERLRDEVHAWGGAQRRIEEHLVALAEAQRRAEERLTRLEAVVQELAEAQKRTEERLTRLEAVVEQLAQAQRRTEHRLEALEKRTEERLTRLEGAVEQLAEAQRRAEERLTRLEGVVEQLAEAQRCTEERLTRLEGVVEQLAEAQRRTEERLTRLEGVVEQLAEAQRRTELELRDLAAQFRGESLERRYRDHAPAYFSPLARRIRVVPLEELDRLLEAAVGRGLLTEDEVEEVRRADLVLVGRSRTDREALYIVVETSATVHAGDIERAAERAALLERAGVRAVAVAAGGRILAEAEALAQSRRVWRVLDGRAVPPEEPAA